MGHPAFGIMGHRPAQIFMAYLFGHYSPDHIRSGNVHITAPLCHKYPIVHGGGVNRPSGRRTHNGRDLGNHSRIIGVTEENLSIARKTVNSFLDPGASRII